MAAKRKSSKKSNSNLTQIIIFIAVAAIFVACYYFGVFEKLGIDFGGDKPLETTGSEVTELKDGDLQVHMLDVGQADCLLVRIPDGNTVKNILIDAGTSEGYGAAVVENYLNSLGIKEIEYMIITHPHLDHIGAADEVIKGYTVKNVIMPDCEYSTSSWTRVLSALDTENVNTIFAEVGKTYTVGEAVLKILAPSADMLKDKDANNFSVVVRLTYKNNSFMFTGDAHVESEAEMLNTFPKSELKCDVLKIGHHGSSTSSSQAFLYAVDPKIVLMSLGKDNDYGHPHKETMEKLNAMNVELLRTDELGTVILVSDGTTVSRLKTEK